MATNTYAPKLPLEYNGNDFEYISDALENIRQNLKMLLLTNPGEKIMDPQYGVGLRKFLFEPTDGMVEPGVDDLGYRKITLKVSRQELLSLIVKQTNLYNPEIIIDNLDVNVQDNVMYLKLFYNYRGFINDSVGVSINL